MNMMNEMTTARFLEGYRAEFLEDIMKLVRIPSVSDPAAKGPYPFGESCARVLDTALDLGKSMGFETENHEYHCGSILMPGTGRGEIGIFAHLDVVPEGTGWKNPPYSPYVEDGWLYGRGSSDNKGPAMAALYAMRYLKESGVKLRHRVRLFLGCSEENGMHDIAYFLEHFPAPDISFTPDASFSVCYSEKGIMEADFTAPLPEGVISFTAGVASNAVAASACAVLANPAARVPAVDSSVWPGISLCQEGDCLRVEAVGQSSHAAFPGEAVNAGAELAAYLCAGGFLTKEGARILSFPAECFRKHYGEGLGIFYESPQLGRLTAVCGMIRTEDNRLKLNINIRYPAEMDEKEMSRQIAARSEHYGWKRTKERNDPPSYVSPDSPLVKALDKACKDRLGPSFEPYTMGGGTYARKLPNAVAFGPGIRGQKKPGPEGHGGGHQPDECVKLEVLENAFHIYVQAIMAVDTL